MSSKMTVRGLDDWTFMVSTSINGASVSLTANLLVIATLVLTLLGYFVVPHLLSPLRSIPGPFLARYTNLYRLYHTTRGSFHLHITRLHKTYGPVVRIGPNTVDIDYPESIKVVFGTTTKQKAEWKKTGFYLSSSTRVKETGEIMYNLFSQIDPELHAKWKRPVAKYYSAAAVARVESKMDEVVDMLCQELDKRVSGNDGQGGIDLGKWIVYYTWDVIGNVTFSQPLGYLREGKDFDGTLLTADKTLDYFAFITSIPWLDYVFDKNRIMRIGPPSFNHIVGLSVGHIMKRFQEDQRTEQKSRDADYLDMFLEARQKWPEMVDDAMVVRYTLSNMIAGADTTSSIIKTAIYYSMMAEKRWKKLREELEKAGINREKCPVSYRDARSVPYLEGLVRESMRILPGIALGLERHVPKGGFTLPSGHYLPEGTAVAMNPYVLSRNKQIWGENVDEFKPERWLRAGGENETRYQERLQMMNSADLTFGAGSRMCLGKNLALMQIYKGLATLALLYNVEPADGAKQWKVINSFFVRQEGLEVRLRKRV
ncbi:Putative cytochrome P450 E-class, group IV [Podospora comata]|uniref:Cytochrome P450 E-class, group IV n=1 Tax=Podospora comata TaxID=48703 RepID=A0ABY6SJ84_PODCO|nr:Putative cytochrome P450 E-class, group IV [Podospora comata]